MVQFLWWLLGWHCGSGCLDVARVTIVIAMLLLGES